MIITCPRHTHQGLDKSVKHGFQQVFRRSGHRRDEHAVDGAATHLGGGALPTSKVWSDLQISPDAHGFPALSIGKLARRGPRLSDLDSHLRFEAV